MPLGSMLLPRRYLLFSAASWRTPAASRSSAARFWCALGPAADARLPLPCRDDLKPPRSRPPEFFFFAISALRAAFVLSFPGSDHRLCGLAGIVRQQNQIEIAGRDLLFAGHARLQRSEEHTSELQSLAY